MDSHYDSVYNSLQKSYKKNANVEEIYAILAVNQLN